MNRIILAGDIPSPANPPKGCKFHTRCSECMNVCKFVTPEYLEVEPNHQVACHLYNKQIMDNLKYYDDEWNKMEEERIRIEQEKQAKIEAKKNKKHNKKIEEETKKENNNEHNEE